MYNSLMLLQDKLTALEAENEHLKKSVSEISDYAMSQMGEWSCVQPPHLPADMEVLYDIIEMCEEAAQHRVQPTPLSLSSAETLGDNSRRG